MQNRFSSHADRVDAVNQDCLAMHRETVAGLREIKQLLKDQK